ncbi:hypothetical protein EV189_0364 [Motilibacter rhizosphaerae]|uniref:Uncharacterized protein n=1 Tax=Motilibacter rhizosphaerae TaxID=598652 RepID=A0A4Q7NV70_9ACTN|nr:hypothetical protein [Motilibacter rhizosphaerae]RZS91131.1 hypothetical protein EV189_0364 [Motilibacter rhizosphaerae]
MPRHNSTEKRAARLVQEITGEPYTVCLNAVRARSLAPLAARGVPRNVLDEVEDELEDAYGLILDLPAGAAPGPVAFREPPVAGGRAVVRGEEP